MLGTTDYVWTAIMRSSPALLLLMAVVLSATPFLISISGMPTLFASWMFVYYWSLFRPTILPYWLLFLTGLLQDIATGLPLGMNALVFMMMRMLVSHSRRFITAHQFWVTWGGFAFVSAVTAWSVWLIMLLLYDTEGGGFLSITLSALIVWIVYPLCHVICNAIYSQLPTLQLRAHAL